MRTDGQTATRTDGQTAARADKQTAKRTERQKRSDNNLQKYNVVKKMFIQELTAIKTTSANEQSKKQC